MVRAAFLLLLALAAPAAAEQTFYLEPDGTLDATPEGEFELAVHPYFGDLGSGATRWERTLSAGGTVRPVTTDFVLRVKEPAPAAPAGYQTICPIDVEVGIAGTAFYYACLKTGTGVPDLLVPGDYPIHVEWSPDLTGIEAEAGDVLYVGIYSASANAEAHPTLFVVPGDAGASVVMEGTAEALGEAPGEEANETDPSPTTTPTATPTASPTASPTPSASPTASATPQASPTTRPPADEPSPSATPTTPSDDKGSPAAGFLPIVAAIALAGVLLRRR